jgi:hypothetical protein
MSGMRRSGIMSGIRISVVPSGVLSAGTPDGFVMLIDLTDSTPSE